MLFFHFFYFFSLSSFVRFFCSFLFAHSHLYAHMSETSHYMHLYIKVHTLPPLHASTPTRMHLSLFAGCKPQSWLQGVATFMASRITKRFECVGTAESMLAYHQCNYYHTRTYIELRTHIFLPPQGIALPFAELFCTACSLE